MSKADTTYWDKWSNEPRTRRSGRSAEKKRPSKAVAASTRPRWVGPTIVGVLTIMLCVTINYRSFAELNHEVVMNEQLEGEIQEVTSRNIALQQEIYELKNDKKTIEREARKIGMTRSVK